MKMEWKVFILSILLSAVFIGVFTYLVDSIQKDFYVLQVGIYSKKENKDQKVSELKTLGVKADYYSKNDQYYVITFISEDKEEVEKYQKDHKIKGIVKQYQAFIKDDPDSFLKLLKEGEI